MLEFLMDRAYELLSSNTIYDRVSIVISSSCNNTQLIEVTQNCIEFFRLSSDRKTNTSIKAIVSHLEDAESIQFQCSKEAEH